MYLNILSSQLKNRRLFSFFLCFSVFFRTSESVKFALNETVVSLDSLSLRFLILLWNIFVYFFKT